MIRWQEVEIQEDDAYEEWLVRILDARDQVLRNKLIPLVKVLWQHHGVEEATWELAASFREKYPELFDTGMF